jgi:outer membrane receptor protein involved in Fe transport
MTYLNKLNTGVATVALGLALTAQSAVAQQAPADPVTALPSTPKAADVSTDTIIVTGTRIASPNLKSVAPVTSVTNADIKIAGLAKAEDLLNQLPQVVAAQSSTLSNGATGTATISLRGLGDTRTLILIDGRRLMPGDPTSSAADVNFIPLSLVKRVDVLTGGASVDYGADAVAGVVNFVLDKDFTGFKIDVNDGVYQDSANSPVVASAIGRANAAGLSGYNYPVGSTVNGNNFDATLTFGTKFADGRGHFMAYAGYRSAAAILQSTRGYSACTLGSATKCGGSATSATGNALYFIPGQSSSTIGALGAHTLTTGAATRYNYAPTNYFQRPDQRVTAGAFITYDASPAFQPYLNFMFMSDHSEAQIAPSGDFGNTLTINCNNPLLSAQQQSTLCTPSNTVIGYLGTYPVTNAFSTSLTPAVLAQLTPAAPGTAYFQLLKRNVEGGPRIDDLNHKDYRSVIGASGDLGKGWHYDAYYQFGEVAYKEAYFNDVSVNSLTNALNVVAGASGPVCASGAAGCVPYDVFSGAGVSPAAISYVTGNGTKTGINTQHIVDANLSGDLGEYGIKSPGSSDGVLVSLGGEFRHESVSLSPNAEFVTGDLAGQGGPTLPISGSFNVSEFIAETHAPIITDKGIHSLTFDGGIRYSHYSYSDSRTFNTVTWKLGLQFQPISDITFRGGINRAVRAPNIQDTFAVPHVQLDGSTDPCSGITIAATDYGCLAQGLRVGQSTAANPAGQYNGLVGGNENLHPEVAITKTLGVVLAPHALPGNSISFDYYDIKIRDAITTIGADAILAACISGSSAASASSLCSLVNRNPAGSLWLTNSGYVTDVTQNIGGVETRGFDIAATLNRKLGNWGQLTGEFDGNILTNYNVDNGVSAIYNCAGYYGVTCGAPLPKWRHKARATLTSGGVSTSLTWRYYGPVNVDYSNPSPTISTPTYASFGSHIGQQSYFDLAIEGRVTHSLTLRAGINNLFDVNPPLAITSECAAVSCNGNTYPGTYDALGRYFHASATLQF